MGFDGSSANFSFVPTSRGRKQLSVLVVTGPEGENPPPNSGTYETAGAQIFVEDVGVPISSWFEKAWADLRVSGTVPVGPISLNRVITARYAQLYNSDQDFKWMGMAAFASSRVGNATAGSWFAGLALNAVGGGVGYDQVFDGLSEGNFAVYETMYSQHLAYRDGGLAALTAMRDAQEISPEVYDAWALIDQGIQANDDQQIWDGVDGLIVYEQRIVLQNSVFGLNRQLWQNVSQSPLGSFLTSAIPDGTSFVDFVPGGDLGDADDRMLWIRDDQVPAFKLWSLNHPQIDILTLLTGGYY